MIQTVLTGTDTPDVPPLSKDIALGIVQEWQKRFLRLMAEAGTAGVRVDFFLSLDYAEETGAPAAWTTSNANHDDLATLFEVRDCVQGEIEALVGELEAASPLN